MEKILLTYVLYLYHSHPVPDYIRNIARLKVKTQELTEQRHSLELRRAELLLLNRDLESALDEIKKSGLQIENNDLKGTLDKLINAS